jgi:hypothetical protein
MLPFFPSIYNSGFKQCLQETLNYQFVLANLWLIVIDLIFWFLQFDMILTSSVIINLPAKILNPNY